MNKKWITIIFGIFCLGIISYFVFISDKTKEYNFESKTSAIELINKGWVPGIIPNDSYDINLEYDLDSNNIWMTFKTIEGLSEYKMISSEDTKVVKVEKVLLASHNNEDWWPSYLNNKDAINTKEGLIIYKFDYTNVARDQYFIIDTNASMAYLQIYYYSLAKPLD